MSTRSADNLTLTEVKKMGFILISRTSASVTISTLKERERERERESKPNINKK